MSSTYPYAMHVEVIQRALWSPRGHAAVMVGSGFSRNAEALTGAAPTFPLWRELTDRLRSELRESFSGDALQLAEEYEHAVGRTALDELLLNLIPDAKYQPGRLHEILLSLPWTDVFTTNYDTLLERARPRVQEAKYDLVLNAADIARSERPRIVKLHGSFPSQRPFIISAEDYRKYPTSFAPFVNMVRQSIMENVFCMIGFSGNDPNFMQWIGWVRDQLGGAAPKIYLCDVLDLSPAKDRFYQSMRVIPVDLGPLVPRSTWTEELRRPLALEWFLISLHNGKPLELDFWPEKPAGERLRFSIDKRLPAPLPPPEVPRWFTLAGQESFEAGVAAGHVDRNTLRRLTESWRAIREGYPGWEVMPELNRGFIQGRTEPWLDEDRHQQVMHVLDTGPLTEKLEFLSELVWRRNRSLMPLPPWITQTAKEVLERLNPKPDLIRFKGLAVDPEVPTRNTDDLTFMWVELAFSLLYSLWTDQRNEDFEQWIERLRDVVRLRPEWTARWYFEQCWRYLFHFNEEALVQTMQLWPENSGLPFWQAKRAAILAAMGSLKEALALAEAALERVRQGTGTTSVDRVSLSEEGWLIGLISSLELAQRSQGRQQRHELIYRLQSLGQYRCNPFEDVSQRKALFYTEGPDEEADESRGGNTMSPSDDLEVLADTQAEWIMLQMFHDGAWPFRAGDVFLCSEVEQCMLRIWPHSPQVAIGVGILSGTFEELRVISGRLDVSTLDPEVSRSLYEWLSTALRHAMESKASDKRMRSEASGLRERLLEGGTAILASLLVNLSPSQLESAFDLTAKMYGFEMFRQNKEYSAIFSEMFRRILVVASVDQLFAWLPRLLDLPLVDHAGFVVADPGNWPEPIQYVQLGGKERSPTSSEMASWAEVAGRLIRNVQEGSPEVRKRAAARLTFLTMWRGLTEKQGRSLVGALWSNTGRFGFPVGIEYIPWVLLELPSVRQPDDARRAVSQFMAAREIEDIESYWLQMNRATAHPWNTEEERKSRIEWSSVEAANLLEKLSRWWRSQQVRADSRTGPRKVSSREARQIQSFIRILGSIIVPGLGPSGASHLAHLKELLKECGDTGVSTVSAFPSMLMIEPESKEAAELTIRRALFSSQRIEVDAAGIAIIEWVSFARIQRVPAYPDSLLEEWIGNMVRRRRPGLRYALSLMSFFVDRWGDELKEHHLDMLCETLGYLFEETKLVLSVGLATPSAQRNETRIKLRWSAIQLATSLSRWFLQRNRAVPPEISAWGKIEATADMPELRRVWEGLNSMLA